MLKESGETDAIKDEAGSDNDDGINGDENVDGESDAVKEEEGGETLHGIEKQMVL